MNTIPSQSFSEAAYSSLAAPKPAPASADAPADEGGPDTAGPESVRHEIASQNRHSALADFPAALAANRTAAAAMRGGSAPALAAHAGVNAASVLSLAGEN